MTKSSIITIRQQLFKHNTNNAYEDARGAEDNQWNSYCRPVAQLLALASYALFDTWTTVCYLVDDFISLFQQNGLVEWCYHADDIVVNTALYPPTFVRQIGRWLLE